MWRYTWFRFIFLTKYLVESAENSISETLHSKLLWGACPQTPLEARAVGACFCEHQLKNSICFRLPPPPYLKLRSAVPDLWMFDTLAWSFDSSYADENSQQVESAKTTLFLFVFCSYYLLGPCRSGFWRHLDADKHAIAGVLITARWVHKQ